MRGRLYRAFGWILLVWLLVLGNLATAQNRVDFNNWEAAATQIEDSIENDALGIADLETLREAIDVWREVFTEGTQRNSTRVQSIRTQLEALGPPPAEGEIESDEIARQRQSLNASLAEARAPQIEAEAALARANSMISLVDTRIRELQADAFFEFKGSPLSPRVWAEAISRLQETTLQIGSEVSENISRLRAQQTFADRIVVSFSLLVAAFLLIVRGPRVIERMVARVESRVSEQGQVVFGFLVSLGTIVLPLIGVTLIYAALISTGILGPVGQAVALGVNLAIIVIATSRWLSGRIFPVRSTALTPIDLNDAERQRGRSLVRIGSILLAALMFLRTIDEVEGYDGLLISVLSFPVFVAHGIVLFLLGGLIRTGRSTDEDANAFTNYLLAISGRTIQIFGVLAPVLAAIGYYNFARGLLIPISETMAVAAFLATLHYVLRAAYGLLRGMTLEESERALMPLLISYSLTIASVPFVALFWGARRSDLIELWNEFLAGVTVGEAKITPGDFITVILVFFIGYLVTRLLQGVMRNSVLPRTALDKGGRNAIVSGMGYVGITLAALAGVTVAGIDLSAFALIVGALGVGIGFGLQNIVNNFVSGIILLIERPISEGDWVEVNAQMGIVKSISVRSTVIETFDRTDVIVPNGDFISGTVTNWTRGNSIGRVIAPVGVAYGTDTRKVEEILGEIAKAHPIVAITPPPVVLFRGFGADSLDFEIRAILTDVNYVMSVHSDLNHEIARRFAEEGIEIPFAQRDIWLRNPEALRDGHAAPTEEAAPSEPRPPSQPTDPSLASPDGADGDGR